MPVRLREAPHQIHVAPLPPGHVDDWRCPCAPILSSLSDEAGELWIHRTAPPDLQQGLAERMGL